MKVLFITCSLEDDPSGGAIVSFELAHAFSKKHETAIIGPDPRQGITKEQTGLIKYSVKSIAVKQININKMSRRELLAMFKFIETFSPDIIHSHSPIDLGLVVQTWAIAHNVPYICTMHALPTQVHYWLGTPQSYTFSTIQKPLISFATQKYFLQILNNCSTVVALNKPAFEDIRKLGYKGNMVTINNGCKLSLYLRLKIADVDTYTKELLYVGSIIRRKNQDFIVSMMKHLPSNYRLHIVGRVQEKTYYKKLKEIVRKNSLKNVIFHGIVPHAKIPELQQTAHVFVSASLAEVQSLSILEALASGTPIISFSNQTTDELVDKEVGYNLPQNTSQETFARKVETICTLNHKKYRRLCTTARQRASRFNLDTVVERTEQMYLKCLAAKIQSKEKVILRKHLIQRIRDLTSSIPEGTVRTTIKEILDEWRTKIKKNKPKKTVQNTDHNTPQKKARTSRKRLSLTTVILTVVTIAISAFAYVLFVSTKSQKKKNNESL